MSIVDWAVVMIALCAVVGVGAVIPEFLEHWRGFWTAPSYAWS